MTFFLAVSALLIGGVIFARWWYFVRKIDVGNGIKMTKWQLSGELLKRQGLVYPWEDPMFNLNASVRRRSRLVRD